MVEVMPERQETGRRNRRAALPWIVAGILALVVAFETGWLLQGAARRDAGGGETRPAEAARYYARPQAVQPAAAPAGVPQRARIADPFDAWDPFAEMDRMHEMMDRMFRDSMSRGLSFGAGRRLSAGSFFDPDLDMKRTDDAYVVTMDLPGIDRDKVNVRVRDGMLVVSGERSAESEDRNGADGFYRMERSFGSFYRSVPLPPDADGAGMTADTREGVLTVRIPRKQGDGKEA